VAALAADLGVWALLYIYSSPQSTRADYPEIGVVALLAPGFALLLIFAASVTLKTALKGRKITAFETLQTVIAFLLAACGLLYFGPGASAIALGIFCMVLSAASYAATFVFFDRIPERRNYQVFATWSAALFLAGSLLCLPPAWEAPCLGAAAIAATVAGARLNRLALEFHGMVYLIAAAVLSGLLNYVFSVLAGTLAGAPRWSIYLAFACAALCYAAAKPRLAETWKPQALRIVSASLSLGAAAALLVQCLMWLTALSVNPGAQHLAFIRTLAICVAAIALAFSGAHWRRAELTRIGYAALMLIAVKLVFEDLRLGHMELIAASIFLFAITLIAVPRIARMRQKV
jgi:hypothetical protein